MTAWRRAALMIEMVALYVLAPIAVYYLVYEQRVPLLRLLPWTLGLFLILLLTDAEGASFTAFRRLPQRRDIGKILGTFLICGSALTLYAAMAFPQNFLALPRHSPPLWLAIMVLYPAISVTTQEIFFRVIYFHRYAPLFAERDGAAIAVNAGFFAFAHAALFAYRHTPFSWEAVAISFAGGLLFARRFSRTGSFWTVALEHSLYGDLIFTVGLGVFFYTGVSSL